MKAEFISEKRGNNLFLEYKVEEGELDDFACQMFGANAIPFMIPFSVVHKDETAWLEYNVTGLKTIESLVTSIVTRRRLISILSGFINAYTEIEDYMLDDDQVVLDRDHVYYNRLTESLLLIYLPICKENREESDSLHYLAELLSKLRFDARDEELENSVHSIVREIESGEISDLVGLRDMQKSLALLEEKNQNRQEQSEFEEEYVEGNRDTDSKDAGLRNEQEFTAPSKAADNVQETNETNTKQKKSVFPIPSSKSKAFGFSIPGKDDDADPEGMVIPIPGVETNVKPGKEKTSKEKSGKEKPQKERRPLIPVPNIVKKKKEDNVAEAPVIPIPNKETQQPRQIKVAVPERDNETTVISSTPARLERINDKKQVLLKDHCIVIGRSSHADYRIDDPKVSREHVKIENEDGNYYITDMESSNHTFVNDKMLKPLEKTLLHNNDWIRIGSEVYVFQEE